MEERPLSGGLALRGQFYQKHRNHDAKVGQALNKEIVGYANQHNESATYHRTYCAGRTKRKVAQSHCVGYYFPWHHVKHDSLAGWHVEGVTHPYQECEQENVPHLDFVEC
jgi:hypothetical protein